MYEVRDLSRQGLPPISFTLSPGELVGLSGPSGCGKTQLLRALVDLDVNSGDVSLDNSSRDRMAPTEWRTRVGLLPAESRWWEATVGEHFPMIDEPAFERLGFAADEVAGWKVERLSSGEKQRLALLRLLANRPQVLLLDEPTANLDEDNTHRVESLVADYLQDHQAACLWVSHDRAQAERIARRRLLMDEWGLTAAT